MLDLCSQRLDLHLVLLILHICSNLLFLYLLEVDVELVIDILGPENDLPQSLAVFLKHALQDTIFLGSQPALKQLDIALELIDHLIFLA